ncbi:Hypothetical_protein [Hexamita inflata]|uniref:Hypothetical_protein n=1 Tax=Hexamita inflata TaxID=28002 RepID=A0AA86TL02_9EUKA|nr:Hypothetical protein HINF_LOCUS8056 [Hexamita inflata]
MNTIMNIPHLHLYLIICINALFRFGVENVNGSELQRDLVEMSKRHKNTGQSQSLDRYIFTKVKVITMIQYSWPQYTRGTVSQKQPARNRIGQQYSYQNILHQKQLLLKWSNNTYNILVFNITKIYCILYQIDIINIELEGKQINIYNCVQSYATQDWALDYYGHYKVRE